MTPFKETTLNLPKVKDFLEDAMKQWGVTRAEAKTQYRLIKNDKVYVNDTYQVNISDQPPWNEMGCAMLHLSIKRLDKGTVRDWRHMQQIKNELVGPDHEAFELYPNENRLVDTANQYHLWCFAAPDMGLPIGFPIRTVQYELPEGSGAVQRPLVEDNVVDLSPTPSQEVTYDMIMEAASMMDDKDIPYADRIVILEDPDTGKPVSSAVDPERVAEIIKKYVASENGGE